MSDVELDNLLSGVEPEPEAPEPETPEVENEPAQEGEDYGMSEQVEQEESDDNEEQQADTDDYGNEKAAPRTYTEDEVNERINKAVRERLSRFERNQQPQQEQQAYQQAKQQHQGFEYDENASGDWQQQLKDFIRTTYQEMGQEQQQQAIQRQEQAAQEEFAQKFHQGMERFNDFREVVSAQPVSDAMTMGLRGVNDPAAFIYAASKRQPEELRRISELSDPYRQMVEIGRLEERMRTNKKATKAPRPVSNTESDITSTTKANNKKQEDDIDYLLAQNDKRRAANRLRRR